MELSSFGRPRLTITDEFPTRAVRVGHLSTTQIQMPF